MQIVLIDPLLDYRAHCVSETLGLMYIAAVLREAGHGVRIVATGPGAYWFRRFINGAWPMPS